MIWIAAARGASVVGLLSLFGVLLTGGPGQRRLLWGSWLAAVAGLLAWLLVQSASMADADGVTDTLGAVPMVLARTLFGHLVLARLAAFAVVAAAIGLRWRVMAAVLAGLAVVLQAGHSHALAMDGVGPLLASSAAHLLAAGAWLGGLLPLLLSVRSAPIDLAAAATRRFSPLGAACVMLLAGTALFQGWVLIGGLPGLIGTPYGRVALLKLMLFAGLAACAALNRFRLTPALAGATPQLARLALVRSITVEMALGLLVVLAAGWLTSLAPAMHVQPVWPFAKRLSLDAVREDADLAREALLAGLAIAVALAVIATGLVLRRIRWPAVAAGAAMLWFAVPHLDLLLVDAYPTSFYHSPTRFDATSINAGSALFSSDCTVCHGAEGRGDGPLAAKLPIPPADLTAAHLWMHQDGELFWWLTHGIDAPAGGLAMPGFPSLSEDQRWALIDYIRAHNAGLARDAGGWPRPVRAPGFSLDCGGRTRSLDDFRGGFVRLVFAARVTALPPGGQACISMDPAVRAAYAVVVGLPERALPGVQLLIDGDGWLRAMRPAGAPGRWDDATALTADIARLRAHPLPAAPMAMDMKM